MEPTRRHFISDQFMTHYDERGDKDNDNDKEDCSPHSTWISSGRGMILFIEQVMQLGG
ncbi:hypothetical protein P692DRAFT_20827478 [Suillus brevipes Sb2]|nr:hypothetical protein P692DRAFT_20827478 [Suillus brevipes Sb2]